MKKIIFLFIIKLVLASSIACPAAEPAREYQIKAGFLYKFLFFTEWPEEVFVDDEAPFTIGILGKNPFGDIFKDIEDRPVNNRKLIIKQFRENVPADILRQCHILFINRSLKSRMADLLRSLNGHPVLTVSEINDYTHAAGMINFVSEENRVAFEINRATAERAGIRFRSKLLRVAARVVAD